MASQPGRDPLVAVTGGWPALPEKLRVPALLGIAAAPEERRKTWSQSPLVATCRQDRQLCLPLPQRRAGLETPEP